MDIFETTQKYRDIQKTCIFIYGDRWESVKKQCVEKLENHKEEYKTVNLLSSAIRLCEEEKDPRMQLILLWSAI